MDEHRACVCFCYPSPRALVCGVQWILIHRRRTAIFFSDSQMNMKYLITQKVWELSQEEYREKICAPIVVFKFQLYQTMNARPELLMCGVPA